MVDHYVGVLEDDAHRLNSWEACRLMNWQWLPEDLDERWSPDKFAEFWAYQRILSDRYKADGKGLDSLILPIIRHL